jgi:hypothetical protein
VDVSEMGRTTQRSTDEPVAGVGEIHAILPVQFFLESATVRTGEQRLMAAVLEDAIALHFKSKPSDTAKRSKFQQEQAQADHWLRSNNRAPVFSFLRICEALNLDPQYLRRGLRRLREQAGTNGRYPGMWMHIRAGTRDESRAAAG